MKKIFLVITLCSFIKSFSQNIPTSSTEISPLLNGEEIPKVSVFDKMGNEKAIRDLIKEKPTVLVFFRGGWCPYCNAQLSGLQKIEPEIASLGYQIIAITPDKITDISTDIDKNGLKYELYSDSKMLASQAFGIAYRNEQTIKNYNGLLQKASGEAHGMLPVPSVFVVDKAAKIQFLYINPDITQRLNEKMLLAVLKSIE